MKRKTFYCGNCGAKFTIKGSTDLQDVEVLCECESFVNWLASHPEEVYEQKVKTGIRGEPITHHKEKIVYCGFCGKKHKIKTDVIGMQNFGVGCKCGTRVTWAVIPSDDEGITEAVATDLPRGKKKIVGRRIGYLGPNGILHQTASTEDL